MDKKLTLSLNGEVIKKAKYYAKENKTSLSRLVEAYLMSVVSIEGAEHTKVKTEEPEITPLVKSLSGIIELSQNFDFKDDYADYLMKKYE